MDDRSLMLERKARRRALATIEERVKKSPNLYLEPTDLQTVGIHHLPLTLKDGTNALPRFFRPYAEDLPLPDKEDEFVDTELSSDRPMWNVRDLEDFLFRHFLDCKEAAEEQHPHNPPPSGVPRDQLGDYKFGLLLECIGFSWEAAAVTELADPTIPHIKAMLISDAMGDERLLRGEIMTITDIMATRLRTKTFRPHVVAPILLVSLMGPRHARVLEASFDGQTLTVRSTELFDFTQRNTEAAQLLARYWLGGACGSTMMKAT
ncbi:hypothetical protein BO70DRAFT_313017 [Aspergillus heteromorphus CBS 117.55]|uniref:Uncharacterized protein n=1 Tax=Aspergillus heteromorphus CBS 117.55 TaxID=1448321 RepID=A0A317WEW0_9EURO|nr:uncharacterized protein BO70DRAFT_313017 [Aspergillus heteromorphus CBS 117.55]PWY84809.1 hypothetical protein BO70DRAFT_313017 [Aspergillus heteromorphus CBS 117.55]